jgi:hypothetical protein
LVVKVKSSTAARCLRSPPRVREVFTSCRPLDADFGISVCSPAKFYEIANDILCPLKKSSAPIVLPIGGT